MSLWLTLNLKRLKTIGTSLNLKSWPNPALLWCNPLASLKLKIQRNSWQKPVQSPMTSEETPCWLKRYKMTTAFLLTKKLPEPWRLAIQVFENIAINNSESKFLTGEWTKCNCRNNNRLRKLYPFPSNTKTEYSMISSNLKNAIAFGHKYYTHYAQYPGKQIAKISWWKKLLQQLTTCTLKSKRDRVKLAGNGENGSKAKYLLIM